ncbi:MAG: hemagglutinin repeat-containing protein [Gammaproteobacteria bacterium]
MRCPESQGRVKVNSSKASELRGMLEVAGERAEVVIANPSGIICDGCGVINAHRMSYTTGRPQFDEAGNIQDYRVSQGVVRIEGEGLEASSTSYTDIIARATEINAAIHTKTLHGRLGATEGSMEPPPKVAIDVKSLGGMYANQIYLVGTEDGVGVRHAGHLGAGVNEFRVTVNGEIENIGTMFADKIEMSAKKINNHKGDSGGAVIGARENLKMTSKEIENTGHSAILSLNEMHLDFETLKNVGSVIDAKGPTTVRGQQVENLNAGLETTLEQVSAMSLKEYEPVRKIKGAFNQSHLRYPASEVAVIYDGQVAILKIPGQEDAWHYNIYDFVRTTEESRVSKSEPAWFSVGGQLTLEVERFLNKDSYVSSNLLSGSGDSFTNQLTAGVRVIRDDGDRTWVERKHHRGRDNNECKVFPYSEQKVKPNILKHDVMVGQIEAPQSLLHRIDVEPTKGYWIETDNRFIDSANYLSSDYLLSQFGLNPSEYIRLGDGAYEQSLIQQQVIQQFGYRFLSGYQDDVNQYLGLMENATEQAKALNFSFDMKPTETDLLNVSKNMIWLIPQVISLSDGQVIEGLVPQLYGPAFGTVAVNGSIISANHLEMKLSSNLENGGSLLGRRLEVAAETIRNTEQIAGGRIELTAEENIENIGGTVKATEYLGAHAGGDILNQTTTRAETIVDGNRITHRTDVDKIARFELNGDADMDLVAGRDIQVQGGEILGETGTINLNAGRAVNLESLETRVDITETNHYKKHSLLKKTEIEETIELHSTDQFASIIGSAGLVQIKAGERYTQTGSHIVGPEAKLVIDAPKQHIEGSLDTLDEVTRYRLKETGLSLGLKSPALDSVNHLRDTLESTEDVDEARLKALGITSMALSGATTVGAVKADPIGQVARAGVHLGTRTEEKEHIVHEEYVNPSSINVKAFELNAKGDGAEILIAGSHIKAKTGVIRTDGKFNMESQQNIHTEHDTQVIRQTEIGVSVGIKGSLKVDASVSEQKAESHAESIVHHQATLEAEKLVVETGSDVGLLGAVWKVWEVVANIGGYFNIESVQDESHYSSKQTISRAALSLPITNGTPTADLTQLKNTVEYHQEAVATQSGLEVGAGGFDIQVAGNTHLTGALLEADPEAIAAGRVKLTTDRLTVEDIENRVDIEAKSSGHSLSSDIASQAKYGVAKALVSNTLMTGDASASDSSLTRTAVSEGRYLVRDSGQDVNELLNHDTAAANESLDQLNAAEVLEKAQAAQKVKQGAFDAFEPFADEAYVTMFILSAKIYEILKDDRGQPLTVINEQGEKIIQTRELTAEEKQNLQVSKDGKIHVATNGINNNQEAATKYADQHNVNQDTQYLVHFPKAGNPLSELLVAAYQKFGESDLLGLTNATVEVKGLMNQYGTEGLHLDGHSRGAMTIDNALNSLKNEDYEVGILSGTTVSLFGPAANAARLDKKLAVLQGRSTIEDQGQQEAMKVTLESHIADPISRYIGGNPATGGVIPEGSNFLIENLYALFGKHTTHNCYGSFAPGPCEGYWEDYK